MHLPHCPAALLAMLFDDQSAELFPPSVCDLTDMQTCSQLDTGGTNHVCFSTAPIPLLLLSPWLILIFGIRLAMSACPSPPPLRLLACHSAILSRNLIRIKKKKKRVRRRLTWNFSSAVCYKARSNRVLSYMNRTNPNTLKHPQSQKY